ncbi:MAG: zf-TFIIB domain-containing protein [Candidatus Methylomirabilis oxyfera]|nr:zf-TFIIB domain-containing protein [Candidatus Methylomirabilis oxyfera]
MRCPACESLLSQVITGGITVDICKGGCGGIWFDRFELRKVDEPHESAGEALLDIERSDTIIVDHSKRRRCPKCDAIVMMRHFHSVKQHVEVDECPGCDGYWLDPGELAAIRREFRTEEEKQKAAEEYFSEIFDTHLAEMRAQGREQAERARNIARIFRFICPSYYIPGKQDWGAF